MGSEINAFCEISTSADLNHKVPYTAIWQQSLHLVLVLRSYDATDLIFIHYHSTN